MMFRDQVGVLAGWFKGWNECEQTVALLSLLKRVSRTQARFLQLCLEHSLADCTELHILEGEANNPGIINQWQQESKDKVISLLLTHLPLLKPGNIEAKVEYMKLLPKILAHSIEHNQHIEESRQLLSYALIHPATSLEDRSALAMWLNHLEDRTSSSSSSSSSGGFGGASSWQDKNLACENGHLPLYSSSSVPTTINTIGTSTTMLGRICPSPECALHPVSPPVPTLLPLPIGILLGACLAHSLPFFAPKGSLFSLSLWLSDRAPSLLLFPCAADVPAWLKSLRLHKYAALFSQMTYEEMMALTECQLEAQVCPTSPGG
uniref:Sterile alpha motif domain containing 4A n=1 Tax=Junco hyemalis TaxID=40217 RepID=A0A8C5JM72_JUNHY